jgi:hypothetical protein
LLANALDIGGPGIVSGNDRRRIARTQVQQGKHEERHHPHDGNGGKQSAQEIGGHGSAKATQRRAAPCSAWLRGAPARQPRRAGRWGGGVGEACWGAPRVRCRGAGVKRPFVLPIRCFAYPLVEPRLIIPEPIASHVSLLRHEGGGVQLVYLDTLIV